MLYDNSLANTLIQTASFKGECAETHAIIHCATPSLPFGQQMEAVINAARRLPYMLGGNLTPSFIRIYLSDVVNQAPLLKLKFPCAHSIVGQSPLDGTKIAVFMILESDTEWNDCGNGIWEDSNGQVWMGDADIPSSDSYMMTQEFLANIADHLSAHKASMLDNCLRTWFFVRDVDTNYGGVVKGRNHIFQDYGLTADTHFIASTGIGGYPKNPKDYVSFNAYADTSVKPADVKFITGSSHLNPTIDYGVAFERATVVDYPDRRRLYISGTASIDNKGEILHEGDIRMQTLRMLENIEVLLDEAECEWQDVAHLIVYLRDISDRYVVEEIFRTACDGILSCIPRIFLNAPVCRPGWLIETEAMAITRRG